MPVTPTYPGVYIEEVPSGVRTIAGVSTSTAVFLGRTKQGPIDKPVLCLSHADFERVFSTQYAGSDLPRQVRLFFQNGGTRCWVMRLASGHQTASVTLQNEGAQAALELTAKDAGVLGNDLRVAVTYGGLLPESTFNLEVFRWTEGGTVKQSQEIWNALSMNPGSPRYAPLFLSQNSALINASDPESAALTDGTSLSGRPVPSRTPTIFRDRWRDLIGTASVDGTNEFRISVDGAPFVDVDLSGIDLDNDFTNVTDVVNNLANRIAATINAAVPAGATVTATMETGPSGPAGEDHTDTVQLQIASANGDVLIQPAPANDLAIPLMLGTAQGGVEVSRWAGRRPAPTGIVLDRADLVALAQREQDDVNVFTIAGTPVSLGTSLETSGAADPRWYQDGYAVSANANNDGVREKLAIVAAAVNAEALGNTAFAWTAEVWGSRLALIPGSGADNNIGALTTAPDAPVAGFFDGNVRYYSLGGGGTAGSQTPGTPGLDGNAPDLASYRSAFPILDKEVDLFNLMILPADEDHTDPVTRSLWGPASIFCQQQRAFLLIDAPRWADVQEATHPATGVASLRLGLVKDHSALYYPNLLIPENGLNVEVGPSGAIAGLMARTDTNRGVWKAPAGVEADLRGVVGLAHRFSDAENGVLNPRAINTLRVFPSGIVSWGARTMDGDDDFGSEWKYVPVRRLALYIEESLYRGTQWVVFEPNDAPLWAQIRLNVGSFMQNLFRQGAFQGSSPADAYLVKCDQDTTTQNDIDRGIVNIVVGFAPLKPAEFVILKIQQLAGQGQA